MDLHVYNPNGVSQMQTLQQLVAGLLNELEKQTKLPVSCAAGLEVRLQHLRNGIGLLERSAQGYVWAIDEMLAAIAQVVDAGDISSVMADPILQPAYEHLGAEYVNAAMASSSAANESGNA